METGSTVLRVDGVSKRYGDLWVLKQVSFDLQQGQVLGLLGRNGAGKSTLLSIMSGCLHQDQGLVSIFGNDMLLKPLEAKHDVGFLPEIPPLYAEMTVQTFLLFCAEIKGVVREQRKTHVLEIMRVSGLAEVAARRIGNLSRGFRQRVGLAQALCGAPGILLLDEPTAGFDPSQSAEFRAIIRSLAKKHSIVFSSHILSEVQAICDRVLILHEGELVYDHTLDETATQSVRTLRLRALLGEERLLTALRTLQGVRRVRLQKKPVKGTEVLIEAERDAAIEESLFTLLQGLNAPILMLAPVEETLEDVFLRISPHTTERVSA